MKLILVMSFCLISVTWQAPVEQVPTHVAFQLSGQDICSSAEVTLYYQPKSIIATRMQVYKDVAYVTLPRLRPGVPFTLGAIRLDQPSNHKITHFPSVSWNVEGNSTTLQSAIDIFLDSTGSLWVLDSGIVNELTNPAQKGPPKLVRIDIDTGKVVETVVLSPFVIKSSRLTSLKGYYSPVGTLTLLIADSTGQAIISYDLAEGKGYRTSLAETMTAGVGPDDDLDITIVKKGKSVLLYLNYQFSGRFFALDVDVLNGEIVILKKSSEIIPNIGKFVFLGNDSIGNAFLRFEGDTGVYTWKTTRPLKDENLVLVERDFSTSTPVQVVTSSDKFADKFWLLQNNYQDYVDNKLPASGATMVISQLRM